MPGRVLSVSLSVLCLAMSIGHSPAASAQSNRWQECALARRNPERSIAACTQILAAGPASLRPAAFHHRGVARAAKGDLEGAVSDVSEGIRLDPRRAFRFQERGELYTRKGEFSRAVADLTEAIRLDPTRAFRFHSRAHAHWASSDITRAIADFTEAIRLDPVQRSFRFHDRANAFRAAGQYERALADYNVALRLEPANASTLINRGRAYVEVADAARAKADFEAALQFAAGNPDLLKTATEEIAGLKARAPSAPAPSQAAASGPPTDSSTNHEQSLQLRRELDLCNQNIEAPVLSQRHAESRS